MSELVFENKLDNTIRQKEDQPDTKLIKNQCN